MVDNASVTPAPSAPSKEKLLEPVSRVTPLKAPAKPVKAAKKAASKTVKTTARIVEKAADKTFDTAKKAQARQAGAASAAQHNTRKSMENLMTNSKAQFEKFSSELSSTGKEQVEALIQSTTICMKGIEELTRDCLSAAQEAAEYNSNAVKSLFGAKTLNELVERQNEIAQAGFDRWMTTATKLSEKSVRIATDSLEPINSQVNKTIKKATDSAAA